MSPAGAIWELRHQIGAPESLSGLGFPTEEIDGAADIVVQGRPVNPRPVDHHVPAASWRPHTPVCGPRRSFPELERSTMPESVPPAATPTSHRLTEDDLTDEVVRRLAATPSPRLREVMTTLVRHLHALAKEVRLTDEEWLAGIRFLTATGQISGQARQEFVLLSDTLGLSSLVDLINHSDAASLATEPTILGPFYVPDSPEREFGASMVEYDDGGEPAVLRGTVRDESGNPIAGVSIDVWQNAATGFYAVQQPDVQPSTNLRGVYRTDGEGRYEIRTVRPVPYPIPDDGPVGRLLRDTGRHPWRAAHIHATLSAPGFTSLTTHVFDRDSDYLDSDTVFGVKESLIEDFLPTEDGMLLCEHDFVLERATADPPPASVQGSPGTGMIESQTGREAVS